MDNNIRTSIGFWDLLVVAFIVLKLCGVIKWSWIWVLAPFWIPIILIVIIIFVLFAINNIL
mgnify:CR=1 FL=1|jgi:hypothetical protein